ncbi:MAG: hypothetical protein QNJ51_23185 [Calothrix sp. MO_167.B12]|nr:hypothetical protein [Calothrix sp. MO_167.B12]
MMVLQVLDVCLALFFCTTGIVGLVIAIAAMIIDEENNRLY